MTPRRSFIESKQRGAERLHNARAEVAAVESVMRKEAEYIRGVVGDGRARAVVAFNLFQTPPDLARRMVSMGPSRPRSILEPSAGLGRIYRAVREVHPSAPVTLVDSSADCCGELYRATEGDADAMILQRDFLEVEPVELYDFIAMNPPFKQGRDIKHIEHARAMLAPGGVLVALCYDGVRQRARLEPVAQSWEPLGPGAFKSEGTSAAAVLLTIEG